MSASINDIVVNIILSNVTLTGKSFRPLIMAQNTGVAIPFALFPGGPAGLSAMVTAGYATTDPEYLMASAMLDQSPNPVDFAVQRIGTGVSNYTNALTALQLIRQDWYYILIDDRGSGTGVNIDAVGAWAQANQKAFIGNVPGVGTGVPYTFPSDFKTGVFPSVQARSREFVVVHDRPGDYPDCAALGAFVGYSPGLASIKFKQLQGQQANSYDSNSFANIRAAKMCGLQSQNGSLPFTNYDAATDGTEFAETIGADFAQATIQNNILAQFLSLPKIGLDDVGIPIIENAIRSGLVTCGQQAIVARAVSAADMKLSDDKQYMYQLNVPARSELTPTELSTRTLVITGSYTPDHGTAAVNLTINVAA